MDKVQFLTRLKRSLSRLPENEKKEILYDYEEHFRTGLDEGKTEEEIARSLGNPNVLGKLFHIDALLEEGREGKHAGAVVRAVFASLGLGFFNIIFILGPFSALLAGLISLWASAASLALSGLAVILSLILQPLLPAFIDFGGLNIAFAIFAAVGASALGLLALIGMVYITRWFLLITEKYIRFNLRIIKN